MPPLRAGGRPRLAPLPAVLVPRVVRRRCACSAGPASGSTALRVPAPGRPRSPELAPLLAGRSEPSRRALGRPLLPLVARSSERSRPGSWRCPARRRCRPDSAYPTSYRPSPGLSLSLSPKPSGPSLASLRRRHRASRRGTGRRAAPGRVRTTLACPAPDPAPEGRPDPDPERDDGRPDGARRGLRDPSEGIDRVY